MDEWVLLSSVLITSVYYNVTNVGVLLIVSLKKKTKILVLFISLAYVGWINKLHPTNLDYLS